MTSRRFTIAVVTSLLFGACAAVGPAYHRPAVETPAAYKELAGWGPAQPKDGVIRGRWWERFEDPLLDQLEEEAGAANQNIAVALATLMQARAMVKEVQAQASPTLSVSPGVTAQANQSVTVGSTVTGSGTYTQYSVPLTASWAPDVWGRVANAVRQSQAQAEVSAADLENVRLTQQAELAVDYFELRGQDALIGLYAESAAAYRDLLRLTRSLYTTGIDSEEAVAQAEVQLETTEAQATNLGVARAQYEHAIAMLAGKAASAFSVPPAALRPGAPAIPVALPSRLLERRPDIAAAERAMAAANAQIGVGLAAYYPNLSLNAAAGIGSNTIVGLLSVPLLVWSIGASVTETILDGGLRGATVEQYRAAYDQAVASYRQAVLTAFQQVEDALASLRILDRQAGQQEAAIRSARKYLKLAVSRYRLGIDPYLNVLSAQTALLGNQQTAVNIRMQQKVAGVQLIQALGGGWER